MNNKTIIPLPPVDTSKSLKLSHFPTLMQAVIFRNWESVAADKIAEVLETDVENVLAEAERMGLMPQGDTSEWNQKGYITIIRNNWHILPYEQLLILLGWEEQRLAFILKEDDFLDHKLGYVKPYCEKVLYAPLTVKQEEMTRHIKEIMLSNVRVFDSELTEAPFAFFGKKREKSGKVHVEPVLKLCTEEYCQVTGDWALLYDWGNEDLAVFAERFRGELQEQFGVKLQQSETIYDYESGSLQRLEADLGDTNTAKEGLQRNKYIKLTLQEQNEKQVNPDIAGQQVVHHEGNYPKTIGDKIKHHEAVCHKDEYHEIHISTDRIEILAPTPVGILRGLTYLTDLASAAGGMYFKTAVYKREPQFEARYIYSYCGLFSNIFDEPTEISFPDELLYEYSKVGVNGVWVQGILYTLSEFPFDKALSAGYEKRRERLKELVLRARRYGIKVYLYINEPRAMPLSFYENYPHMKGSVVGDYAAMCTTHAPEVLQYLGDALQDLCLAVPDLGGFFTITMAENLTHCYSRGADGEICPHCLKRTPAEIVAEINNTIAEAVHEVAPSMKVIATTWAWKDDKMGRAGEDCIRLLRNDIVLMCVSENALEYEIAGYKSAIIDYSISIPGPSERSRCSWNAAKENGMKTGAKVQINNSWECSTVPYLPVYGLIIEHLQNLSKEGVNDLMLSWTLGGYPSPNIKIASAGFFKNVEKSVLDTGKLLYGTDMQNVVDKDKKNTVISDTAVKEVHADSDSHSINDYDNAFRALYGEDYELVKRATALFCEGFREFPFHVKVLYRGPQNGGPANLLYNEPSGFGATMTCYAFDDLEQWRYEYPEEVFENQFRLICEKWEQGLTILESMKACEFKDMAYAGYALFKASYNQIRFVRARNRDDKVLMRECAKAELELATNVYRISLKHAGIGYEAANHYYYSRNNLMEKIVNCDYILRS